MTELLTLNDIYPGERVMVKKLDSADGIRRRLLDIGLIENTQIECVGQIPFGDPKAFMFRGAVIALRSEDCEKIAVWRI